MERRWAIPQDHVRHLAHALAVFASTTQAVTLLAVEALKGGGRGEAGRCRGDRRLGDLSSSQRETTTLWT